MSDESNSEKMQPAFLLTEYEREGEMGAVQHRGKGIRACRKRYVKPASVEEMRHKCLGTSTERARQSVLLQVATSLRLDPQSGHDAAHRELQHLVVA